MQRPVFIIAAMALVAIVSLLAGCASRLPEEARSDTKTSAQLSFRFIQEGDSPPRLSTNQVMQIAWQTVRTNRIAPEAYFCDYLLFTGDGTNAIRIGTNTWVLHFLQKQNPWELHSDFFLRVEDSSGDAKLLGH